MFKKFGKKIILFLIFSLLLFPFSSFTVKANEKPTVSVFCTYYAFVFGDYFYTPYSEPYEYYRLSTNLYGYTPIFYIDDSSSVSILDFIHYNYDNPIIIYYDDAPSDVQNYLDTIRAPYPGNPTTYLRSLGYTLSTYGVFSPTPIPTYNPNPTAIPTYTPVPNPTYTPVPNPTNTPVPVATNTPLPRPTNTPVPVIPTDPLNSRADFYVNSVYVGFGWGNGHFSLSLSNLDGFQPSGRILGYSSSNFYNLSHIFYSDGYLSFDVDSLTADSDISFNILFGNQYATPTPTPTLAPIVNGYLYFSPRYYSHAWTFNRDTDSVQVPVYNGYFDVGALGYRAEFDNDFYNVVFEYDSGYNKVGYVVFDTLYTGHVVSNTSSGTSQVKLVRDDSHLPQPTFTPTPTPTSKPILSPIPTNTPVPKPTYTPVPKPTNTPVPVATNTPLPRPTNTPVPLPAQSTPIPTYNPNAPFNPSSDFNLGQGIGFGDLPNLFSDTRSLAYLFVTPFEYLFTLMWDRWYILFLFPIVAIISAFIWERRN